MNHPTTASIVPGTTTPGAMPPPGQAGDTLASALHRAARPGYHQWLAHIRAAAGCSRPIRLTGDLLTVDLATGLRLDVASTDTMPDGIIYKPCGNRRATVCPSCSAVYQNDAYQLLRAGLAGGKGVPEAVATHPAVFATFTAPSFGTVHTRTVRKHRCHDQRHCTCRPQPCRARRPDDPEARPCPHGRPTTCFDRHSPGDKHIGQPLCLDCYDHDAHVVWHAHAGELWRRTKQAIDRHLAHTARARGMRAWTINPAGQARSVPAVRTAHGKVAEYQTRAAVHFHALLRLDGVHPTDPTAITPPPDAITIDDLDQAIRHATTHVTFTTAPHPITGQTWSIAWGQQIDIRRVRLDSHGDITDQAVASYLAKYATKSTEATGHTSTRITRHTIDLYTATDSHTTRLIEACWRLGTNPTPLQPDDGTNPYLRLRRWAHMLGFGGHFLTKARRYSTTFAQLRTARAEHRRADESTSDGPAWPHNRHQDQDDTVAVIGHLTYTGTGWHTLGDALLANTAAAQAREHRRAGHEELAHQFQTATAIERGAV